MLPAIIFVVMEYKPSEANMSIINLNLLSPTHREKLTANRNYYVATTGNDGNSGLHVLDPFKTVQKAVDTVCGGLDMSNYSVTINIANGSYTTPIVLKPYVGTVQPIITGNAADPNQVWVSTTANNTITANNCMSWDIRNMQLAANTSGSAIYATGCMSTVNISNIQFGQASGGYHVYATYGSTVNISGTYKVTGRALAHWGAMSGANIVITSPTIILNSTYAFDTFADAAYGGFIRCPGITFSGSATGQRYAVLSNGVMETYGGGINYMPGNSAGAVMTGGQYI